MSSKIPNKPGFWWLQNGETNEPEPVQVKIDRDAGLVFWMGNWFKIEACKDHQWLGECLPHNHDCKTDDLRLSSNESFLRSIRHVANKHKDTMAKPCAEVIDEILRLANLALKQTD